MNPLQYTSEEMFSSTELIRKSKMIFDRLHKKDIEKAIILRDGKPSFMLLDFSIYESIMKEYILLKSNENTKKEHHIIEKILEKPIKEDISDIKELDEKDLEEALAQIDELDLESFENKNNSITEKESLKEFWE